MNSDKSNYICELSVNDANFEVKSYIEQALSDAEDESIRLDAELQENLLTIQKMTPDCNLIDYLLAAGSGALCGIIDIFLVSNPKKMNNKIENSILGKITDNWFAERTKDFARLCGWDNSKGDILSSALDFLQKKFKVPYDQTNLGEAAKTAFNIYPNNHHFLSLAHNPSLLGLFFAILDQFNHTSHFVVGGELIILENVNGNFVLYGNNEASKFVCAFVNWIGHLISDQSGSSSSKGRGMGIPSPLWTWCNDIIAIKRTLNIEVSEFEKTYNDLAEKIFVNGYDARFQTTQAIPVFVNETITRFIYSLRRLFKYFKNTSKQERNIKEIWKQCEPFSNSSVKRMLTVAHGTFVAIDASHATISTLVKGKGTFNAVDFYMKLNIVGAGRFAFSLYGEGERVIRKYSAIKDAEFIERQKQIVRYYIEGLNNLAEIYDDKDLMNFVEDLKQSEFYEIAFEKTVKLAEKRVVPDEKILKSKSDIDNYFLGG